MHDISVSKIIIIFLFHTSSSPLGALLGVSYRQLFLWALLGASTESLISKQQRRHLEWAVTVQTLMRLSVCIHSLSILAHAVYFIINLNCRCYFIDIINHKYQNSKFESCKKKSSQMSKIRNRVVVRVVEGLMNRPQVHQFLRFINSLGSSILKGIEIDSKKMHEHCLRIEKT